MGILNNKLVGVLIYNDEIIEAIMCEEISTDISDLVEVQWFQWCIWLGQGIAVVFITQCVNGCDGNGYTLAEDSGLLCVVVDVTPHWAETSSQDVVME